MNYDLRKLQILFSEKVSVLCIIYLHNEIFKHALYTKNIYITDKRDNFEIILNKTKP